MTPEQAQLIEDSFEQVSGDPHASASLFYGRMFELDPTIKPLFEDSRLKEQERKLMDTLRIVVISLDRLDKITSVVRHLGERHTTLYHVQPSHYAVGREALVWMLEQTLGTAYTPEVGAAWLELYDTVTALMLESSAAATV